MSVPLQPSRQHTRLGRPVYNMAMPFDPNALRHHAEEQGMSRHDAAVFAHLALSRVRIIYEQTGMPVTSAQLAETMRKHALEEWRASPTESLKQHKLNICEAMELEVHRASPTFRDPKDEDEVQIEEVDVRGGKRMRYKFSEQALEKYFDGKDPYEPDLASDMNKLSIRHKGRDILSALCQNTELAVEIGRHLGAKDICNLYSTSRVFHYAINGYLLSSVRVWIQHRCPEAGKIFAFKLYKRLLVPDPMRRTWAQQLKVREDTESIPENLREIRSVPGLKYFQLVDGRDRCCREIIAIMARSGHRMTATMHKTLLRLWLLMDVPTSFQRQALLRNTKLWSDVDLYNVQFLLVKLGMHFNDPIYGPNTHELIHLMMGQKGLFPLWQLLMRKRFTHLHEILELKVRYDFEVPSDHWGSDYFDQQIHGVSFDDIGRGHLESWGRGEAHLMRPDELIPLEAVMRGLELDKHLMHMVVWGYIDWETGENLVPSMEEMHISDEEDALADMDTTHHWRAKHVLKKKFESLTAEQQQNIIDEDEDERLRAMACLDDEIHRGFIAPDAKGHKDWLSHFSVPGTSNEDVAAWRDFTNVALVGMPPVLHEDEELRAQAYHNYRPGDFGLEDWEWNDYDNATETADARWAELRIVADGEDDMWDEADDEMDDGAGDEQNEHNDEYDNEEEDEEDDEEAETIIAPAWTAGD